MTYNTSAQYFENLLENPSDYNRDIAINALKMLERAYNFADKSMDMFNMSQESESENDYYWNQSALYEQRSRGILDAYEILTNRTIANVRSSIKFEIDYMKEICEEL